MNFQVSKNNGSVTIAHFARILAYLGILLSADDFNLLVKKYLKDSYTLNYIAFLRAIFEVVQYLDQHGILDLSGVRVKIRFLEPIHANCRQHTSIDDIHNYLKQDIMAIFPGRVINAELPKLPRPEIGKIMASKLFGKQNIFHPALEDSKKMEHILTTMSMIQEHVMRNRLRVEVFFKVNCKLLLRVQIGENSCFIYFSSILIS